MEPFYLTLTSSGKGHFADTNKTDRFRVQLGRPLDLRGAWEVGLAETHVPSTLKGAPTRVRLKGGGAVGEVVQVKDLKDVDNDKPDCNLLHIGSDLIEDQKLDHKLHNNLRTINVKKEKYVKGTTMTHSFGRIFYYKVKKNHITAIDFYITNDKGEQASFASGELILLLHFRPMLRNAR